MASEGYPGSYEKGRVIHGLEEVAQMADVKVFHAGTARADGRFITAGGRVLGVTARAQDIPGAIKRAYEATRKITWEGVHYRRDIGKKASALGLRPSDFPPTRLRCRPVAEAAPFFPNRFYLEVSSLDAFDKRPAPLPCVASFPIHYEQPADRWKSDVVQSIGALTLLRQPHPEKRLAGEYHFRPPAEMQQLFAARSELLARSRERPTGALSPSPSAHRNSPAFSAGRFHAGGLAAPASWRGSTLLCLIYWFSYMYCSFLSRKVRFAQIFLYASNCSEGTSVAISSFVDSGFVPDDFVSSPSMA